MYVIGTAGHVDHGKSALVEALTGIDPDRLREEKERGLTIDLGFAWLTLPSGREVSIVDVPGHERFIKNMLSGVGGIDLALLVVAADEGVMPQTREHLAILDLLQVGHGVVVVTKKDLVDEEWLELVVAEVEELLKPTTLAAAPIVTASAVTREGLDTLREVLDGELERTPPKADLGRPRLPIDRVFTISGFGTVVTGTLIDGSLSLGQEVEVVPSGQRSRIRGLQTHRRRVERAPPGTRVAANLTGLATEDLARGEVVTAPRWLQPGTALDASLRLIEDIPRRLNHNASVSFHSLAAEAMARVRLLDRERLEPGEEGWVQLRLDRPLPLVKGDLFILRSSWGTIGGGRVVDPQPKRHRRFHGPTLATLATLDRGSPEELLLSALERGQQPAELGALGQRANLPLEQAAQAALGLVGQGRAVMLGEGEPGPHRLFFSAPAWERLRKELEGALGSYHRQHPLRSGMAKEELRSRSGLSQRAFAESLERLRGEGALVEEGALLRLPGHQVRLSPAQEKAVRAFLDALEGNPFSPPSEDLPEAELLAVLIEQGRVVKVADNVVFASRAYQEMVERIVAHLRAKGTITVAQVRDMFGTSRKYALALMEHLDQLRVTRRVGDERRLRGP